MQQLCEVPCVILAGGKSSRMGEDKALLPFGGFETLSEYLHVKMSRIFSEVYISTKSKDKFDFQANFIEDLRISEDSAPTVALLSCCEYLKSDSLFVISVDTPFVTKETILKLINSSDGYDITVASTCSGMQPMCGVYSTKLKETFQKMVEDKNHRLGKLIKNSNSKLITCESEDEFMNLNYKDEYNKAVRIADESNTFR
ncbi:MAG: molybdenum cofactor guanylyltransferase MobA [Campylobacterota bacterium]|nr:molybdenum cofactor guanylyltransferase MobA [Campylobacterota bacterium]